MRGTSVCLPPAICSLPNAQHLDLTILAPITWFWIRAPASATMRWVIAFSFPRRGWVHCNRLVDPSGVERWPTLPLQKAPQDVLIRDLRFAADAPALRCKLAKMAFDGSSRAMSRVVPSTISRGCWKKSSSTSACDKK